MSLSLRSRSTNWEAFMTQSSRLQSEFHLSRLLALPDCGALELLCGREMPQFDCTALCRRGAPRQTYALTFMIYTTYGLAVSYLSTDLLQALRSSGVHASYSLAPSNSSLCLVCASPPDLKGSQVTSFVVDILQHTKLSKRENVILADLKSWPSLIIT
ncbi:hypothetical protein EV421DRAFT_77016 [Armillaria borealis]|uniref:Uncharacterized protein n=1 Tax=Armillaria borealis TaxID=47425 RepID=A0AA39K909_9AGAR|nr:hypothetical protein EV421DRAFT_77016 [Armillaria borealis]